MPNVYVLSESERDLIREVVDAHLRAKGTPFGRSPNGPEDGLYQTPEVYVVKTTAAGIPARSSTTPGKSPVELQVYRSLPPAYEGTPVLEIVDNLKRWVLNLSDTAIDGNIWVVAWRDKFGQWYAGSPGGGADGFWARLTDKTYVTGCFTQYTWHRVTDDGDASCKVEWDDVDPRVSGGPGDFPAYEVNNVDVPVSNDPIGTGTDTDCQETGTGPATVEDHTIVWLRLAPDGDYYLFSLPPRWEFVKKTSDTMVTVCGKSYYPGVLMRYNQSTKLFEEDEAVLILDVNAPN